MYEDDGLVFDDELDDFRGVFVSYVKRRLLRFNKNWNGVFIGEPGSGKSWSALRLAERINSGFSARFIVFSAREFQELVTSDVLRRGDVVLFDEAGVGINKRVWWSVLNRVANQVFQTIRNRNFATIFTSPFAEFIDSDTRKLFNTLFRAVKIDFASKRALFKPYKLGFDIFNQRPTYKFYKFLVGGKPFVLKVLRFGKPRRRLVSMYEEKKLLFQRELYEAGLKELDKPVNEKKETFREKLDKALALVEPRLEEFLVERGSRRLISSDLLRGAGLNSSMARAVKVLLEKKYGLI